MFDTKTQDNPCDQLNNTEVRLVENHLTEMGNKLTAPELSPHPPPLPPNPEKEGESSARKAKA